jgi:sulfite exporter TauE/SafE
MFQHCSIDTTNMFRIASAVLTMLGVNIHGNNSHSRWLKTGKFAYISFLILGLPMIAMGLLHIVFIEELMPKRFMAAAFLSRTIITVMRIRRLKREVTSVNDYVRSNFTDIEYPSMLHKNIEV